MDKKLEDLIAAARRQVDAMTPAEIETMFQQQAKRVGRAEAQWAKSFREGKCERD